MSADHWDEVYAARAVDEVSWFQRDPSASIRLVEVAAPDRSAAIADVGCGASFLVDRLLDAGYVDITLVDVSTRALETVRTRLGDRATGIAFVGIDVLAWMPDRAFDVWHDRAAFHFLTDERDRAEYVERAANAVRPGGALIVATFAGNGPTQCSGLPVRRHDSGDLARTFSPAFVLEAAEEEEHVTPAGVVQPFTWAAFRRT